ncbi:Plasma membrane t-SNARE, secretory vesicle fusion [Coemansia spiralis]|uniref:Plasma membrane t-SNARE, secretory vesicle fusion n=2 Tax=Coemansia TaxID=4863 RepID=A0A9W8GN40_9FUNG|nr:Plasma membrane t-SNARE, secretory vesicle fusion [Coemansia spiralis]
MLEPSAFMPHLALLSDDLVQLTGNHMYLQCLQIGRTSLESVGSQTDVASIDLSYQTDGLAITTESSFARVAENVNEHIGTLEKNIIHIERLHSEAIYATSPFRYTQVLRTREQYADDTDAIVTKARAGLQAMERAANDPSIHKGDRAMRGNRHVALARKLRDQIESYRKMEREQATRNRDRLARLYKVACPSVSDVEIYGAIEDPAAGRALALKITEVCRPAEARRVLKDVADRQGDIVTIERMVGELTKLHIDISEIVNRQQRKLDTIVVSVERVETSRTLGRLSEKGAQRTGQIGRRRRTWWIILVAIALVIAIALSTTLGVLKSQGRL